MGLLLNYISYSFAIFVVIITFLTFLYGNYEIINRVVEFSERDSVSSKVTFLFCSIFSFMVGILVVNDSARGNRPLPDYLSSAVLFALLPKIVFAYAAIFEANEP